MTPPAYPAPARVPPGPPPPVDRDGADPIAARRAAPPLRFVRALARSRLVHFLVIGGAIFWAAPRPRDDRRVVVSRAELAIVEAAEAARHGTAALDRAKADEVRGRIIEDKLLFAEGVRLGLDQDDPMIRQRVVQKVLLLAEELGGATRELTQTELRAAYARTRDRYHQAPRYHLMHVFAARRDDLPAPQRLETTALPNAGEPFPLPRDVRATADELRRGYGAAFADAVVAATPSGEYSAPVASTYGWHRLRVVDVTPGRVRPFEEVAREVAFDAMLARREATVRRFLDATVARYEIVVDGAPLTGFVPPLRLARREAASGED